ncbi:MAG TPA: hypothetical protein VGG34_15865 [Opitutaceae bacterium]
MVPADATDLAVKRGQTKFDKRELPLVCLEVSTYGLALPLETVVVTNMSTHEQTTLGFRGAFEGKQVQLLTAATKTESLSLPIFHLPAGKYSIETMYFDGPTMASGIGVTTTGYTMNVSSEGHKAWFEVRPGCVNFVGGIRFVIISGRRGGMQASMYGSSSFKFQSSVQATRYLAGDAKWACDEVPCISALPAAASAIQMQ